MESFGKYRILERLGIGGMGEVFRARATGVQGFQKDVVLKVILPDLCDDDDFRDMFIDEAKISVRLQHANIVQVFDLGEIDGRYYIAMEHVDGRDLSRILRAIKKRGTPFPIPLCLYTAMELLKGLDYAHKARGEDGQHLDLVHRDVTPHNVLVSFTGEVKLSDFGIARVSSRSQQKTAAGQVKGKFAYMPPEQIEGGEMGPWTDVFAAGLVLHTMLTGVHPLSGQSELQMIESFRKGAIPLASEVNEDVPPILDPILQKALAPKVADRYRSAHAFLDALEEFCVNNRVRLGGRHLSEFMVDLFREELVASEQKISDAPPSSPKPGSGSLPAVRRTPSRPVAAAAPEPAQARTVVAPSGPKSPPKPVPAALPRESEPADLDAPPAAARRAPAASGDSPRGRGMMIGALATTAAVAIALSWFAGRALRGGAGADAVSLAGRPATAAHGWIDFDMHPWADCTLDGKPVGATPLVGLTVSPGPHVLEFRSVDGREGRRELTAVAGKTLVLRPE